MRVHWAAALLASVGLLWAVSSPATPAEGEELSPPAVSPPLKTVQRVYTLRYRDVSQLYHVMSDELGEGAVLTVDGSSRTVVLEASPEKVKRFEEFLARFDIPPQSALVRVILEKATRPQTDGEGDMLANSARWTSEFLAETVLEVLERGKATHAFGEDGAFEIHVALASVDPENELMLFEDFAIRRNVKEDSGETSSRLLLRTDLLLEDGVPKTVMATRGKSADVGLVVKVVGLIRKNEQGRR